jgi:hypothetical protein
MKKIKSAWGLAQSFITLMHVCPGSHMKAKPQKNQFLISVAF